MPASSAKIATTPILLFGRLMASAQERRGRGRPRQGRDLVAKCRAKNCEKRPAEGQVYCSRDHAPYGWYALTPEMLLNEKRGDGPKKA
jgi:hypothetical protein